MEHQPSPSGVVAIVFPASGLVGSALTAAVQRHGRFADVVRFSRTGDRHVELLSEDPIDGASRDIASRGSPVRPIVDTTGFIDGDRDMLEGGTITLVTAAP